MSEREQFIGWIAAHFQSRHTPPLGREEAMHMATACLECLEADGAYFGHPDYDWSEDGAVIIAQEEIDSCWEFEG